jgi:hypothetical protein
MGNYKFNDIEYPGVTTIIDSVTDKSGALMGWAVKMALQYVRENFDSVPLDQLLDDAKKKYREVSQEAMDIGSEVHKLIENHINAKMNNKEFDTQRESDERVTNAYLAFLDWEKENIDTWLESEKNVFSATNGFAGTLDAIAKFKDGKVRVIDFKSSKGFYDGYDLQIAAYRYARENCNGLKGVPHSSRFGDYTIDYPEIKIDGCGILRLDKETGQPEYKDYTKVYDRKINAFLKACDYYYELKKRRLKNNPRVK